jgi:ketosteroid isomerase-like protein
MRVAQQLLASLGAGADPDEIAALFSVDVQFVIDGDVGALPWIGRQTGRSAVTGFIRGTRSLIEQTRLDVQDVLAGDEQAVILGELTSKILATGKTVDTAFAIVLTVVDGSITRFRMLEDSFAVSRAARE